MIIKDSAKAIGRAHCDAPLFEERSGLLLRQNASNTLKDGTPLHVCIDTIRGTVFIGFATIRGYGLCETWQVALDGNQTPVPSATHEIFLTPYSPLGLHWLQDDRNAFVQGDLEYLFTEGEFSKTLSFAVFEEKLIVYSWTFADVAPVQIAELNIKGWSSMTTDITFERCFFYVATTGHNPVINKFDARDPRSLLQAPPLATSVLPLQGPCCLVTVYENSGDKENPSILLLDQIAGTFIWLSSDLEQIENRKNWEGLSRPLEHPCSLSCNEEEGDSNVHADGTADDVMLWSKYTCYIADRDAHRVVQINVDVSKKTSAFTREDSSAGTGGDRLYRPVGVVAFKYNGETLLFVLQVSIPVKPLFPACS